MSRKCIHTLNLIQKEKMFHFIEQLKIELIILYESANFS